eukprot:12149510-Alexandrium_andersonii.AAC.1
MLCAGRGGPTSPTAFWLLGGGTGRGGTAWRVLLGRPARSAGGLEAETGPEPTRTPGSASWAHCPAPWLPMLC